MQAGKALKTAAAFMLSVAMLATGAACGTSDDSDASASKSSSKSSELTGYDVSGVKKDDAIAKMLPDYVTKDGKLTIGMDTSYAPAEFLAADGKTPVGFDVDIVKALAKTFGPGTHEGRRLRQHVQGRFHVGGQEGQPEQGRHVRSVRIEDRGADRHRAGRGSQHHRQRMRGR